MHRTQESGSLSSLSSLNWSVVKWSIRRLLLGYLVLESVATYCEVLSARMFPPLILFLLVISLQNEAANASSIRRPGAGSSINSARSAEASPSSSLPVHCRHDRFVSSSPLAVAAVCADGVALLAVHTAPSAEALLMEEDAAEHQDTELYSGDSARVEREDASNSFPPDLPLSSRGPFRIEMVDDRGTAILTAGWRADCVALADRCRSVAAAEAAEYGHGSPASGDRDGSQLSSSVGDAYSRGVALDVALWMSRCAVSEDVGFYRTGSRNHRVEGYFLHHTRMSRLFLTP